MGKKTSVIGKTVPYKETRLILRGGIKLGEYFVQSDAEGYAVRGLVTETCPACNGGKKVGGLGTVVMECPVCVKIDGHASGLIVVEVGVQEAIREMAKEERKGAINENI